MKNIAHTTLLPYQHSWKEKFDKEKSKLLEIFGNKAIAIEHIGSTSIPGLLSKPIVDIAVLIKSRADADAFTEPLASIGYMFHSSSTERHFYTKGNPIEYHVSIAYADQGGFLPRQILFRDYLRAHPEALDEYAVLKEGLLQKDPTGKGNYTNGKTDFIQKVLKLAGWEDTGK